MNVLATAKPEPGLPGKNNQSTQTKDLPGHFQCPDKTML
jgi:hypothetical protein